MPGAQGGAGAGGGGIDGSGWSISDTLQSAPVKPKWHTHDPSKQSALVVLHENDDGHCNALIGQRTGFPKESKKRLLDRG